MEVNDEGNQYCFTTNDKNRYIKLSKNRISNPEDAAEIMRSFIGNSDREHLILICMNSKMNLHIFKHYRLDLLTKR